MKAIKRTTSDSDYCEMGTLQRVRYFPRQLITKDEMTLDQNYARDRQRRHNRLLHGWGVVCGTEVCAVQNTDGVGWQPWKVRVRPGFALGPMGDEIIVSKERELDLRVPSAIGGPEDIGSGMADPWCRPMYQDTLPEWVYLAIRYREVMTRQVRVQPAGCDCDDSSCEFSRICDGYEFGVLPNCPSSHLNPPAVVDLVALINRPLETCPECPDEDWVVLAAVQLDPNGRILAIDNCSCRRMVVSFAGVWGRCTNAGPIINKIDPDSMIQGEPYDAVVSGSNFQQQSTIALGPWAKNLTVVFNGPMEIKVHADIDANAPVGEHILVLSNPDCSFATYLVQVKAKQTAAGEGKETPPKKGQARRGGRR